MSKTIIVFIIIFLIIGSCLIYFYFKYEKNINELQFADLSIFAIEKETKLLDRTGYKIFIDNIYYGEGITSKGGAVFHKISINKNISMSNYNLDNQHYYIYTEKNVFYENKTYRIVLNLIKPGELLINHTGEFDDEINLTIISKGISKDVVFCVDYSTHVIYVDIPNFVREKDRCYFLKDLNNNEKVTINFKYATFGILSDEDYINFHFFDKIGGINETYEICKSF